jgi:NADH-quinone oxidoreductase subunit H
METQSAWITLGLAIAERTGLSPEAGAGIGVAIGGICILLLLSTAVAYMVWWLRKLSGWMQSRLGPSHVGRWGLLQTPADALKLLGKESITPTMADSAVFTLAPVVAFVPVFLLYVAIPFTPNLYIVDLGVGVVFVAAVTSVAVIGTVLGAWASNNKYALLAAFRGAGQMVSYEIPFALALLAPVILAGSLSFLSIVQGPYGQSGNQFLGGLGLEGAPASFLDWFVIVQPIALVCFFIAGLAENNAPPFDLVEAESEIVAGFHIEYSGAKFALFYLAEFAGTFTLAALTTLVFLGGWTFPFNDAFFVAMLGGAGSLGANLWHLFWFFAKIGVLITCVFWVRASVPRVRVDQIMDLGWKVLIPITLVNVLFTGALLSFGWPRAFLAALNWGLLVGLLVLGATRRAPSGGAAAAGGEAAR